MKNGLKQMQSVFLSGLLLILAQNIVKAQETVIGEVMAVEKTAKGRSNKTTTKNLHQMKKDTLDPVIYEAMQLADPEKKLEINSITNGEDGQNSRTFNVQKRMNTEEVIQFISSLFTGSNVDNIIGLDDFSQFEAGSTFSVDITFGDDYEILYKFSPY